MPWKHQRNSRIVLRIVAAASLALLGCHQYPNVFVDDLPDSAAVKTMSLEYALRTEPPASTRTRDFKVAYVEPQDGTVAHGPLWFESPLEMTGSDDGRFAVTDEELLWFLPGAAWYLADVVFLPVSMICDPPDTIMCSDGVPRRAKDSGAAEPYDAERCHGTALLPDIDEVWTFDQRAAARLTPPEEPAEPDEPAHQEP